MQTSGSNHILKNSSSNHVHFDEEQFAFVKQRRLSDNHGESSHSHQDQKISQLFKKSTSSSSMGSHHSLSDHHDVVVDGHARREKLRKEVIEKAKEEGKPIDGDESEIEKRIGEEIDSQRWITRKIVSKSQKSLK